MIARARRVPASLRRGFVLWWQLGPWAGTVTAVRMVIRETRAPVRAALLDRRPIRVRASEVALALGESSPRAALRGQVLRALPTVAAWEDELRALGDADRADLLARADAVTAHRFDLLGSGPTDLGPEIDWQCDFKSGRRWPLVHISRVPITYPDSSDVKVPWELSRFQHAPLLAAAALVSGERRYLDELGAQLDHWARHNPVEFGANWAVTMDVAIRAANWVAALCMCAEEAEDEAWFERAVGSLLLHGRFIRSHLEWGDVRGNHYLSDVVGLLPVAALFCGGREGRAWAEWAVGELVSEMEHQVHPDGCDHEASIPYHRLVCELLICGTQAADALTPGRLPASFRERLDRMLGFVAGYTRPDGLAPQVGDADDGRFLPLDDYARADPRSHLHLFRQAGRPALASGRSVAYRDGGYYVMRSGDVYAIVRCGDTGLQGRGGHGHNDQLSFELSLGAQPMVIDPGAYLYTADPDARNLFRSTAFHSTLRIGDAEQNALAGDYLFSLPDHSRAEAGEFGSGGGVAWFAGCHHGFEALGAPALHSRRLELDGRSGTLVIEDTVESSAAHPLEWTFPLAPPCRALGGVGGAEAEFECGRLVIECAGLEFAVEQNWYSPRYGVRVPTPFVRARRRSNAGRDVIRLRLLALPA